MNGPASRRGDDSNLDREDTRYNGMREERSAYRGPGPNQGGTAR
jgi:hypothetical protein